MESHNSRKKKIRDFSEKLEDLLNKLRQKDFQLPMYVFIDELDRCKPLYAIQLLEGVKHIFGTKGLFFIIATNKTQLSKSIKAVYGSEFDSLVYLQRFFDQEYQLPKPDFLEFSKLIIDKVYRLKNVEVEQLETDLDIAATFAVIAKGFNLSLRAQDQAAKQFKAITMSWSIPQRMHHWYMLFLIMFKIKNEEKYDHFCKSLGNEAIGNHLLGIFDSTTIILGSISTGDVFRPVRVGAIRCIEIFERYRLLENESAIALHKEADIAGTIGAIKRAFLRANEIPYEYSEGKHYPLSIASYKQLLLHAGQLS